MMNMIFLRFREFFQSAKEQPSRFEIGRFCVTSTRDHSEPVEENVHIHTSIFKIPRNTSSDLRMGHPRNKFVSGYPLLPPDQCTVHGELVLDRVSSMI
jgi:hypothetical protein